MDDESYKCADCGKDLRLHTKEELEKCILGMADKEKEMGNVLIEMERSMKESGDWLKFLLDNSDKENPLYPIALELHEEYSKLNSRLSEYRPGKLSLEDCNDAIIEYERFGRKMGELLESYKKLSER